jgi:tRNA(Ile2) C34 agmatinyltransferase TiaS
MKLENVKTLCCNSKWYRKGRANYRCVKCDSDVTIELVLLADAMDKDLKNKEQ